LSAVRDGIRLNLPPMRVVGDGHIVKCHLTDADLDEMEPVFSLAG
jgi:peptide/nickel transport system ATP-binding protein